MNILFLTTHLNTGGITSYLLTLSKGLIKKGHKVYIVSSGGNMVEMFEGNGARHLKLNIRTKSELSLKIYWNLGRVESFVHEKAIDVIHAQTRVTQVMGFFVARDTGVPCVSTCHGFFKTRLSRRLFPFWGKGVIAISPAVEEHLKKDFRVSPDKVSLVMNGLDVSDFVCKTEQEKKDGRESLGLPEGPLIGIIARLSDVKGHEVLIKAMYKIVQKILNARLLIVGQGKMEDALRQQVNELNLQNHVFFSESVNEPEKFLPLFDLFVMPSLQEGLGLSVMEAQAAGLPVVASRVGGIPSLVEDGRTGRLVKPGDADELAKAIISVSQDNFEATKMGLRAREFVIKNFSADEMVDKTIEVYNRAKQR